MKIKVFQLFPLLLALLAIGFRYFSTWCIFSTSACYGTIISHIALSLTKPLYIFSLFFSPIALILIFIPNRIFKSWLKFVAWAIPLIVIFIAMTPVSYTGLGLDFFPFYRDDAARLAGGVFSAASLILIIWKSFSARNAS